MAKYFYLEWSGQTDEEIHSPSDRDLVDFNCAYTDAGSIAEAAAEEEMRDAGTDLSDPDCWPRKYYLYAADKTYLGLFSVEMEYSPDFYAHEITE